MKKTLSFVLILFSATFAAAVACPSGPYANTYDLQIPARGGMAGDLTSFTVYFAGNALLAQTGSGGQSQTAGGLDIVPCDAASGGNLIAFERINYTATPDATQTWYTVTVFYTLN